MEYKYSNKFNYKNVAENIEMSVYTLIGFLLPVFIGHPQIIVGITVNAVLIMAALNLKGYKLLPVIIAPALGALMRGMLFGPFTIYLVYMIPFIWIGNAILVFFFRWLKVRMNKNYFLTLIIGAVTKSGFLFLIAFLLFRLEIIPAIFLTSMGILQLSTALIGGVGAYFVQIGRKNIIK